MDCWHCRKTAVGSCRFCGRGICEDHVETLPFVLELFRGKDVTRALVVEDALYCGGVHAAARSLGPSRAGHRNVTSVTGVAVTEVTSDAVTGDTSIW